MKQSIRRSDLLYPELGYDIVGCAFDIYNTLGSGYHEKYYQNALMEAFTHRGIAFRTEVSFPLRYNGKVIGRKRLDFLVEEKVVVELKRGDAFSKTHIDQVVEYLRTQHLNLAILVNFGSRGVLFKRIVNL